MGLFDRISNPMAKEVKLSAELAKKRDALAQKWPAIQEAWNQIDEKEVLPLAAALSVAMFSQNRERITEAREALKRAIWERDDIKAGYERELSELNGEIEVMSGPVIFAKCAEWQNDLSGLRKRRAVEVDERFTDVSKETMPAMIKYRANFQAIRAAKLALLDAIRELRGMRDRPLSEVHAFIEATEAKLKAMDLTVLTEEGPITERRYAEIIAEPEMIVRPARGSTDHFSERFFRASARGGGGRAFPGMRRHGPAGGVHVFEITPAKGRGGPPPLFPEGRPHSRPAEWRVLGRVQRYARGRPPP